MRLFSNVIKEQDVAKQGQVEINTEYRLSRVTQYENNREDTIVSQEKTILESYECIGQAIIDNARRQSEELLKKAYEEAEKTAEELKTSAAEAGYNDGYSKGYSKALEEGKLEAQKIVEESCITLKKAKEAYEQYLVEKEQSIRKTIYYIVEQILKREVAAEDGIGAMLSEVLKDERNARLFILKANKIHSNYIKNSITTWQNQLALKGDFYVVEDNSLNEGTVVVEKDNGKIIISIDNALEKLQEILEGKS